MTSRFVSIMGIGLIPIAILSFINVNIALMIFLIYNVTAISLYFVDRFITPKEDIFVIERNKEEKLYFKTSNKIEFQVKNNYSKGIIVELKDDLPSLNFNIEDKSQMKILVPSYETKTFSYDVFPYKRGSFNFSRVFVRYTGILGLCKKQFTINTPFEYKVYPNLKNIGKYRLIVQKHRLLTMGNRRINLRGQGSEFESLREYVEGDDYRKINWMTSARENKLIVNQYEAEKNQPVFILIDTGKPMSYSIKGFKKLDYAINAALILSDIVNQKGDNSGLMVFNTDITKFIPPGKGDVHRNEFMEALYHIEDTKASSDYENAFLELITRQKRRSIIFVFTDFETGEEVKELISSMPILSKRHLPVIITMVNESLEKVSNTNSKTLKGTFEAGMAESLILERQKIIRSLNKRGLLCVESPAEEFALNAVNQYLLLKQRNSG